MMELTKKEFEKIKKLKKVDNFKAVFEDYYGEGRCGVWVFYVKRKGKWIEATEGKDMIFAEGISIQDSFARSKKGILYLHVDLDYHADCGDEVYAELIPFNEIEIKSKVD